MKNTYYYLLFSIILWVSCASPKLKQTEASPWQSLFDGKNLDGWTVKIKGHKVGDNYAHTFRVEDGILQVNYDKYDNYGQNYGALYYQKSFKNYRLKVEYRFVGDTAKGAPSWGYRDSGIQYHCQSPYSMDLDQDFPICLEYNLHGGNGKDERPVGQICTIGTKVDINGEENTSFCTPATIPITLHGDQWVTAEIEVKGDTISHWVNGAKILEFTQPRYDSDNELAKKLIKGNTNALNSGYISLQSNSHPIEFRKIDILPYP